MDMAPSPAQAAHSSHAHHSCLPGVNDGQTRPRKPIMVRRGPQDGLYVRSHPPPLPAPPPCLLAP
eukprot:8437855-Pyramimonas_sp.AAC.1